MTSRISLLQPKKFWVHWRYTLRLFDGQLKIVWCNSAIPRILSHFPSFSQILLLNSLFLSDGYLIFGYIWCFISRTLPVQSSSSFSPLFLIIFSSFFIIFHHFPSFSPLFSIIFHHFPSFFPHVWWFLVNSPHFLSPARLASPRQGVSVRLKLCGLPIFVDGASVGHDVPGISGGL